MGKCFATHAALVRPVPSMRASVRDAAGRIGEFLSAYFTLIGFISRVQVGVYSEVSCTCEQLPALGTLERFGRSLRQYGLAFFVSFPRLRRLLSPSPTGSSCLSCAGECALGGSQTEQISSRIPCTCKVFVPCAFACGASNYWNEQTSFHTLCM